MDCLVNTLITHMGSLLTIIIISLLTYQLVFRDWGYFSQRDVPFLREWPITRMLWLLAFAGRDQRPTLLQTLHKWYSAHPGERLIGIFEIGGRPVYVVRDPELIKTMTIAAADHFAAHRFSIDEQCDPMVGRSLFFMKEAKWRQMRSTLSPLFTGHKMRAMFTIIDAKAEQFVEQLHSSHPDSDLIEVDMKDIFTRFATDMIASCAFGVEVNSLQNRNNEFYTMAKEVSNFEGLRGFAMMLAVAWPRVAKLLRVSIVPSRYRGYFTELLAQVVGHRRELGVVREDIVHLLMELGDKLRANEGGRAGKMAWTDDDMVAQCMGFFLAGYDPVSNLMSFMAHEITVNPHVQDRLFAEIQQCQQTYGQQLSYTLLSELRYLDAVASETLRMWPPTPMTDRCCTKAFDVRMSDGHTVHLQPGDALLLPIHAVHMDPQYYEEPHCFRPERWLRPAAKPEHTAAGTFLPFGVGARNCLGSRFALMEAKLGIFHLLRQYRFGRCDKTQQPLRLKPFSFSMLTERGVWVRLERRTAQ